MIFLFLQAKENEKKELAKKKETLEAVNKEYDRMKNSNMTDESESILPPGFSEQSLRGAIDELTEEVNTVCVIMFVFYQCSTCHYPLFNYLCLLIDG